MPSGEIARITSIIYGISWAEACYSVEVAIANPFNKYFQAVEIGWFVFVDSKHTEAKKYFFLFLTSVRRKVWRNGMVASVFICYVNSVGFRVSVKISLFMF